MTTSVTNQLIANNEFKVSGNCLLYTQLPAVEGEYEYSVATLPGEGSQTVVKTGDRQSLIVSKCIRLFNFMKYSQVVSFCIYHYICPL